MIWRLVSISARLRIQLTSLALMRDEDYSIKTMSLNIYRWIPMTWRGRQNSQRAFPWQQWHLRLQRWEIKSAARLQVLVLMCKYYIIFFARFSRIPNLANESFIQPNAVKSTNHLWNASILPADLYPSSGSSCISLWPTTTWNPVGPLSSVVQSYYS